MSTSDLLANLREEGRATHLSTERVAHGIACGYRNAVLTVKAKLSICHCRHPGLVLGSILSCKKKRYGCPVFCSFLISMEDNIGYRCSLRSSFLSTFPTLVFAMSSTNLIFNSRASLARMPLVIKPFAKPISSFSVT